MNDKITTYLNKSYNTISHNLSQSIEHIYIYRNNRGHIKSRLRKV